MKLPNKTLSDPAKLARLVISNHRLNSVYSRYGEHSDTPLGL